MCRCRHLKMTYGPRCPVNSWLSLTDYQSGLPRDRFLQLCGVIRAMNLSVFGGCDLRPQRYIYTHPTGTIGPFGPFAEFCHMTTQHIIANVEPGCLSWTALFAMTLPFCTWLKCQKTVLNWLSIPFFLPLLAILCEPWNINQHVSAVICMAEQLWASASSIYSDITIPVIFQSPGWLVMVIITSCSEWLCTTSEGSGVVVVGVPISQPEYDSAPTPSHP